MSKNLDLAALGIKPLRKPGCTGRVGPQEMAWIMRQAERTVPIEARVELRLRELHEQVNGFTERTRVTPEDWKIVRRRTRHGLRVAKRFGNEWYTQFFQTLYSTAAVHCHQQGYL
ncbi:MAG: hypothetical protein WCT41_00370 [Candidatus Paceibacterota bacterium]